MSRPQDLQVDAYEPFDFAAQWLHADNTPYDLSNADIVAHVRGRFPTGVMDPAPVAEFACLGDDSGWLYMALSADETGAIPPGSYVYDVLVTPAGGTRRRLLRGTVQVSPAVTIPDDEGES